MKDLLVIVLVGGFFAVCVAYVALCDRIIGPDGVDAAAEPEPASEPEPESGFESEPEPAAASEVAS